MSDRLALRRLQAFDTWGRTGRVRRILPTFIEADGPAAPLGTLCAIEAGSGLGDASGPLLAEVVGVHPRHIVLAPLEHGVSTFAGARVEASARADRVAVGDAFLGRAIDALGRPIDGGPAVQAGVFAPLHGALGTPLDKVNPERALETGIRAIDGLLTLGHGQRIGLFAAAGVGKTTLMSQIARQSVTDRCVVCLIGERGREVDDVWNHALPPEVKARSVLVASTSDQTAAMRVRAADYALALSEYWRGLGHDVLIVMDSMTRLAMALRELGLAAGEPPTIRAYTPGVFAAIPRLVERCGALRTGGSITAVMTVLAETDDVDDPIVEMMKSLLDGHIVLSRDLAQRGQLPAIDVTRSISRLADRVADPELRRLAGRVTGHLAIYEASRTLIEAGVYVAGVSAITDAGDQAQSGHHQLSGPIAGRADPGGRHAREFAGSDRVDFVKSAGNRLKSLRLVAEVRRAEERAKAFLVLETTARLADIERRKSAGHRHLIEQEEAWAAGFSTELLRPELFGGQIAETLDLLEAASTLEAGTYEVQTARVSQVAHWREALSRQSVADTISAFARRQVSR